MKNLLEDNKSFLVRFCVHCDKSLLKISVASTVVSNKQSNLKLSILTVVLLCLQAYKRMSWIWKKCIMRVVTTYVWSFHCTSTWRSQQYRLWHLICVLLMNIAWKKSLLQKILSNLTLTLMDASYFHRMVYSCTLYWMDWLICVLFVLWKYLNSKNRGDVVGRGGRCNGVGVLFTVFDATITLSTCIF